YTTLFRPRLVIHIEPAIRGLETLLPESRDSLVHMLVELLNHAQGREVQRVREADAVHQMDPGATRPVRPERLVRSREPSVDPLPARARGSVHATANRALGAQPLTRRLDLHARPPGSRPTPRP